MNNLKHFGILGMKWGVRRGKGSTQPKGSDDHIRAKTLKKKKLSEMSNEELKALTTRMQLERQYKDLKKSDVSRGQKVVNDLLSSVGKQLLSSLSEKYIKSGIDQVFGDVIDAKFKD